MTMISEVFPFDVTENILPRLPVKSLLRFSNSAVNYVWRIHSDIFGFWYDGHVTEYNIVVLEFDSGDTINVIEYSFIAYPKKEYSYNAKVRRSFHGENIPYKRFDHDSFGIFHDGCLNWLASNAMDVSKKIILVYGCWTKKLYELPLPANKNCDSLLCLTILGGNLCVVFFSGTVLDVWEMHEYGVMESWVMLRTLEVPIYDIGNPPIKRACNLFFYGKEEMYEVLDIPLPELQDLRTVKVDFHQTTKDEVGIHYITLPRQSTVADLLIDLKRKVELSHLDVELRFFEVDIFKEATRLLMCIFVGLEADYVLMRKVVMTWFSHSEEMSMEKRSILYSCVGSLINQSGVQQIHVFQQLCALLQSHEFESTDKELFEETIKDVVKGYGVPEVKLLTPLNMKWKWLFNFMLSEKKFLLLLLMLGSYSYKNKHKQPLNEPSLSRVRATPPFFFTNK
ncbi:hypothetical protein IFM89_000330 [Coptis chinensis]|uniref:ubiquitinyl hydrolase 1 n=1 Tax=Coptis chinensis TaxID=261450 RepID=A0A835HBW8_9MAGN|nr:hypothetical protein IFM89_000330 [Coptis chinensis]